MLIALLLVTAVISSLLSELQFTAFGVMNRVSLYFLVLIIAVTAVKYFPDAGSFIIKSFIYGNIILIVGSILDFYFLSFHNLLIECFERPQMIHSYMIVKNEMIMRPMGFITDSNLAAFSIAFALMLLVINHKHFNKFFTYGFYIAGSYVFGMLTSRASLIMCIICISAFIVLKLVERKELIIFSILFIIFQMITPQMIARVNNLFDESKIEEETSVGRLVVWNAALNVFYKNLVIGVGPGVFFELSVNEITLILERNVNINITNPEAENYHKIDNLNPHNIFLVMLSETGVTGFVIFLILILSLVSFLIKGKKYLSLIIFLGILFVSALSNFAPYYKFYLFICIIFYVSSLNNMKIKNKLLQK